MGKPCTVLGDRARRDRENGEVYKTLFNGRPVADFRRPGIVSCERFRCLNSLHGARVPTADAIIVIRGRPEDVDFLALRVRPVRLRRR